MLKATELLAQLRARDEGPDIEAKRGSAIDKSVQETICAFANEPGLGGGYLFLGAVRRSNDSIDYQVVGVQDTDKLQLDLASQCSEVFNVVMRPEIAVEECEGQRVVVAFIPEVDAADKPVFIKRNGLPKGAYRRIGSADVSCSDDDVAMFFHGRGRQSDDESTFSDTSLDDVDPAAIAEYRRLRKDIDPDAEILRYSDAELLRALGATATKNGQVVMTLAGLMLFGKSMALRRLIPQASRVDYIRVEGREWVPDSDRRYITVEKREALLTLIPSLVALVLDDLPKAFSLEPDGIHRQDVPLIPRKVIREAVVNAVMHRSYREHGPTQIIRFSNRLEIRNAGYSLIPEERFGEPQSSATRNPKIAAALHDVHIAETKGTGIRTMRKEMAKANLSHPFFESDRHSNSFTVRLLTHHFLSETDWAWLAQFKEHNLSEADARALILVREVGNINNAQYRELNHVDTLAASKRLGRLRDEGLLNQQGQGKDTFYMPSDSFNSALEAVRSADSASEINPVDSEKPTGFNPVDSGKPTGLNPVDKLNVDDLPAELQAMIRLLGKRTSPNQLREAIRLLCSWRPISLPELAKFLGRTPTYLRTKFLTDMVRKGELAYLYPDVPAHPKQAYKTPSSPAAKSQDGQRAQAENTDE